ncbi:hypothetical protein DFH28DRAFT_1131316 [Melampsora americana]|nr:hypothetical protein DFH28DRAFT_1131316 [Melampsora americana]
MPLGSFGDRSPTADLATESRPNSSNIGDASSLKNPASPVLRRPSTSSADSRIPTCCQQCASEHPFVNPSNPDQSYDLAHEKWDPSSMRGQQQPPYLRSAPIASLSIKTNVGVISWDERRARARALAQITHDLRDHRLLPLRPSNSHSTSFSSTEVCSRQPSHNSNWTHDSDEPSSGCVVHSPASILISSPTRSSQTENISSFNNQCSSEAMESLNFSDEEEKVRFVQRGTFLERYEKQRHASLVESFENHDALIPSADNSPTSFTTNFKRAICKNLSARPGSRNAMKYLPIKPSKPKAAASQLSHSTGDTSLPIEIVKTVSVIVEDNIVTPNPAPSSRPLIDRPFESTPDESETRISR